MLWDVVIVGAGPAGSAAALAALRADPSAAVLLCDRSDFPRDKPCGDGVSPQVDDELAALGVHGLLDDFAPVHRLRLSFPRGPAVEGVMQRPARVVPRTVLDARLLAAATGAGAVFTRARVRGLRTTQHGVQVETDARAGEALLSARVVIGADGAHSAVASSLAPRSAFKGGGRRHTAFALRGYVPAGDDLRQVIAFAEGRRAGAGWPAYAWSFPIGDGSANVGYGELLPSADGPRPSRAVLLERLEALLPGARAAGSSWRGHHLPLSSGRRRSPDGPVLLAGDALRLVNPLTGEGIHAAVLSGAVAGRCAAAAVLSGRPEVAGRTYRAALRARFGRHLRDVALAGRLARAPRVLRAGVVAACRDEAVFHRLVDVGLADGVVNRQVVFALLAAAAPHGRAHSEETSTGRDGAGRGS